LAKIPQVLHEHINTAYPANVCLVGTVLILPKGGILRLYGRAKIHKSGAVYEEIWNRLIEEEKKGDPEKRGYAVLVTIERAEDLSGQPLT
jgi:hypothetical protein